MAKKKFDPYREALVVETLTRWPEEFDDLETADRQRISQALHATPEAAADLIYDRTYTGFCRVIEVTQADIDRVS